jgi:histidinol dehydrogenase
MFFYTFAISLKTAMFVSLQVTPIVDDVRRRGDDAVREYTSRFDRVDIETACVPIDVSAFQLCSGFTATSEVVLLM